ncbi:hypothetical protein MHYP_G00007110 [Metynnis hypsauchen]
MKRGRKHRKTKQSTAPQEMKHERELSPPPSPPACGWNCVPKMSLFRKKGRKQERQKEEEQLQQLQTERREMELTNKETTQKRKKERQRKKMEQENDEIRDLEEAVRLLDEEIQAFRERKKELKRELKTLKKKIAGVEMKTRQTKEWKKEMEAMKDRMVQEEKQREEKRTGQKEVICKEIVITVVKTDREMEEKKEKREDKKMAAVNEKQDVIKERKSEEELLEEMEKQREEGRLKESRGSQEVIETGKEVMIEMENLQMEPAAPSTSRKNVVQRVLSSALSSVQAGVQSIMEFRKKFSAQPVQVEEEELKVKSCPLVPLGAPTGVLTIHIRSCRDFRKNTHVQEDTQCMVKITVGRTVKCSRLQPFKENLIFNEAKHFSIQIQKEEALGVQLSSSVKVDLISFDGDSPVPKLMGSTTISLKEVLYKSSVDQQTDLRLGSKKVCKLDTGLTFTYGSFGYGYSHQMKHPGRKMDKLVEESLFLRCPPPEDRRDPHYIMSSCSAQCRISAGVINCMDRRGRLSQLNKALEDCETVEDRVQLLEGLILKTRPRTSSPCTMNQTPEIRSKETEERRREENSEDAEEKAEETVKKGKSKYKTRK